MPAQIARDVIRCKHGHILLASRMRSHPPTLAYAQRRRAEGKTDRKIRRCIKRATSAHTMPGLRRPDADGWPGGRAGPSQIPPR
jgi:hypothetical protein